MTPTRQITVETVEHGYALTVDNKQWLLDDEQHLAEAIVFRVLKGVTCDTTRHRMRKLLYQEGLKS